MRNRTTLAACSLLAAAGLLTACGSSSDNAGSKPTTPVTTLATTPPTTPAVPPTTPATTPTTAPTDTATTAAAKKPKPKPKPKATDCMPARDVYVWEKVAGVEAMAEALGDYSNCGRQSTFDMIRDTSPTEPGDCTEAGWASDNPGYNTDADPAPRLKHAQLSVGPGC